MTSATTRRLFWAVLCLVAATACTEGEIRRLFEQAETARADDRFDDAIDAYRAILALDETTEDAHNNLGTLHAKAGRYDSAMVHYRRAIALRPGLAQAHFNLGVAYAGAGFPDSAEAAYQRTLAIAPEHREAVNNLGVVYEVTGRLASAAEAYGRAKDMGGGFADAWHNLGRVRLLQGQVAEAIAAYARATQLKDHFPQAHNDLGSALAEAGRLEEAEAAFEHALALRPDFDLAKENLARIQDMKAARDAGAMRARHIVVANEGLARSILEQIRNGADFADLARTHSRDPSAARGGDLGAFQPGDLLPAFEAAVKGLAPGETGGPVKTGAGWHVIQRMY